MKQLIQLLLCSLILLSLLGCKRADSNQMRLSSWVSSPSETALLKETLETFRQQYPDIDFKYEPIPGNYSEKIQLMLGTYSAPDVFYLKGLTAPSYMSFDILKPLNEFIEQDTSFQFDDFFPFVKEAFEKDGKYYGIAKDFNPYVLFYNKKMFEEAGIDSVPSNWAELEAAAQKLTKDIDGDGKIDQYGIMVEPSLEMLMPFVYQNGGSFQDENGDLAITEDAFVEALEFYYGLYQKDLATIPMDVGTSWNGDAFGRKAVAMVVSGGWLMPFLEDNYPDIDFGIAHLPQGKERATVAFTTAYSMPKATKHPQEAWELTSYLTGKEGMAKWTSTGLAMPTRKSVAEKNGFYTHPIYKTFMESAEFARPLQVQYSERGYEEAGVGMQAIFFTEVPPRKAMEDLAKRIKKYKLVK